MTFWLSFTNTANISGSYNSTNRTLTLTGNDSLTARGKLAFVNGGSGHNVAFVRASNMKFARSHGCRKVHAL